MERYTTDLAASALTKKQMDPSLECAYETQTVRKLSALTDGIAMKTQELELALLKLADAADITEESVMIRDSVLDKMSELRMVCDEAEVLTAKDYWPFPKYGDLLFGVG